MLGNASCNAMIRPDKKTGDTPKHGRENARFDDADLIFGRIYFFRRRKVIHQAVKAEKKPAHK